MATLGGGTIVVGVRGDGEVVAVDLGAGAQEQLTQRILAGTDPRVFVRLRTERIDNCVVLRIDVLDRLRESAGFERQIVPDLSLDSLDPAAMSTFVELAGPRGAVWDGAPTSPLGRLRPQRRTPRLPQHARLGRGEAVRWAPVR